MDWKSTAKNLFLLALELLKSKRPKRPSKSRQEADKWRQDD